MNWIYAYVIVVLTILSSCSIFSKSKKIQMHDKAYEYVIESSIKEKYCQEVLKIKDKQCKVAVADSSVFMGYSIFMNEFVKMNKDTSETKAEVIRFIYKLDKKRKKTFESVSVKEKLQGNKPNNRSSNLGLFFSSPYENTLMVELLNGYTPDKSYQDLTQFNNGIVFLFFFNNNGKIKRVFKEIIHYN